jgi:hypothetical protein
MKAVLVEVDAGLKALERAGDVGGLGGLGGLQVVRATQDAVADIMRRVVVKVNQANSQQAQAQAQALGQGLGLGLGQGGSDGRSDRSDEVALLRREKVALEQHIRQLEASGAGGAGGGAMTGGQGEVQWRARCDTLVREREAVQTIMEQKIKVLVQSVSNALDVVLDDQVRRLPLLLLLYSAASLLLFHCSRSVTAPTTVTAALLSLPIHCHTWHFSSPCSSLLTLPTTTASPPHRNRSSLHPTPATARQPAPRRPSARTCPRCNDSSTRP